MKALALKEMEGAAAAADQVKLADGWWAAAEKETGTAEKSLQDRAGRRYKKALPGLSGLVRGKAEKRLAELERDDADRRRKATRLRNSQANRSFSICKTRRSASTTHKHFMTKWPACSPRPRTRQRTAC